MKTKWMIGLVFLLALSGRGQTISSVRWIGDAGNTADATGYGAVNYPYYIGTYEITISEFQEAGIGNGEESWWNWSGVGRTVGPNAPAVNVSLYEAMHYCNYLTSGNIGQGAYNFTSDYEGASYLSTDRASALATYDLVFALPTENEWYKAAYYTRDVDDPWSLYANGTDSGPEKGFDSNYDNAYSPPNQVWAAYDRNGSQEQNGTYDMMGNVWEWMEDDSGIIRGGGYFTGLSSLRSTGYDDHIGPEYEYQDIGIRIVVLDPDLVPEPTTPALLAVAMFALFVLRRLKQNHLL